MLGTVPTSAGSVTPVTTPSSVQNRALDADADVTAKKPAKKRKLLGRKRTKSKGSGAKSGGGPPSDRRSATVSSSPDRSAVAKPHAWLRREQADEIAPSSNTRRSGSEGVPARDSIASFSSPGGLGDRGPQPDSMGSIASFSRLPPQNDSIDSVDELVAHSDRRKGVIDHANGSRPGQDALLGLDVDDLDDVFLSQGSLEEILSGSAASPGKGQAAAFGGSGSAPPAPSAEHSSGRTVTVTPPKSARLPTSASVGGTPIIDLTDFDDIDEDDDDDHGDGEKRDNSGGGRRILANGGNDRGKNNDLARNHDGGDDGFGDLDLSGVDLDDLALASPSPAKAPRRPPVRRPAVHSPVPNQDDGGGGDDDDDFSDICDDFFDDPFDVDPPVAPVGPPRLRNNAVADRATAAMPVVSAAAAVASRFDRQGQRPGGGTTSHQARRPDNALLASGKQLSGQELLSIVPSELHAADSDKYAGLLAAHISVIYAQISDLVIKGANEMVMMALTGHM